MVLVLKHKDGREIVRWIERPSHYTGYIHTTITEAFNCEGYTMNDEGDIFVEGNKVGMLVTEEINV